jgi:hypothetical protein
MLREPSGTTVNVLSTAPIERRLPAAQAASRSSGWWAASLEDGPGDRVRLAAGEEPAGCGGGQRHADDREAEVEDRHVAQISEEFSLARASSAQTWSGAGVSEFVRS